jgi:hypothetical protein
MAERVAEAISKCTFHKHLLFFGFVTCALATHASRADDQTLDLQRASEVQTDLRGTRLVPSGPRPAGCFSVLLARP